MASFLNTDLTGWVDDWKERSAFNEGYKQERFASAKQAGRDAFSLGLDRTDGRDSYFAEKDSRFTEAAEFQEEAVDATAEVDDDVEVDDLGTIDDLGELAEDDFVPFDPAEDWEIAMENSV